MSQPAALKDLMKTRQAIVCIVNVQSDYILAFSLDTIRVNPYICEITFIYHRLSKANSHHTQQSGDWLKKSLVKRGLSASNEILDE